MKQKEQNTRKQLEDSEGSEESKIDWIGAQCQDIETNMN